MLRRRRSDDETVRISDRAAPLIEEAAERSRVSMRTRFERLRLAWRSILQASVAAGIAWLIATEVFGHTKPFFAPVSAIITLGITVGQRGRRAFELALGVALGIAVADLLVLGIGTGTLQLMLVVGLATAAAILLGTGQLFASQAAVSAALVATLQPPTHGITFSRFIDALVGGGVALVINAVLLPAHPVNMVRRAAEPLLDELADTLEDIAVALEKRDSELATAALERARRIDELEAVLDDAVDVGRETIRYSLPRRGTRGLVDSYGEAAARMDLAVRNVRVLARGAIRGLSLDENVPPEVAGALRDLAASVRALGPALDEEEQGVARVREPAIRAAADASLVLERTGNLSVSVIVGQVRSTAVDLLMATGMTYDESTQAVRAAVRAAQDSLA